ncbi:unnamed protein product, partial [marine sediment metagenome]
METEYKIRCLNCDHKDRLTVELNGDMNCKNCGEALGVRVSDNLDVHILCMRMSSFSSFTDQQVIDLHAKGLNDTEIAERLGVGYSAVNSRRRKLGLKIIKKVRAHKRLFTDQQLINLHKRGLNDREIAKRLGVAQMTVNIYRNRLGLKTQKRKSRRRLFNDQQLIALYNKGMTDKKIAGELGAGQTTVRKYRRRLGLKAHEQRPRRLFMDEQLKELYEKGLDDGEIAEKLGAARRTVNDRRRKLGLKQIQKQGIKPPS